MKYNELQKMLKKKRIDLGITQVQMAAQLGVSASFLNNVERGNKNIPVKLLGNWLTQFDFSHKEMKLLIRRYIDDTFRLPECGIEPETIEKIKASLTDLVYQSFIKKRNQERGIEPNLLRDAMNQMFGE